MISDSLGQLLPDGKQSSESVLEVVDYLGPFQSRFVSLYGMEIALVPLFGHFS